MYLYFISIIRYTAHTVILRYHTSSAAKSAKLLHPSAGVLAKEIELIIGYLLY